MYIWGVDSEKIILNQKKIMKKLLLLGVMALILTSCATTHSTNGLGVAAITSTTEPVITGPCTDCTNLKTGEASAVNVLGIVIIGDCSISAAAKDGDITKIKSVDKEVLNILGIFGKVTVIVEGE
jgi:hypothetical protein